MLKVGARRAACSIQIVGRDTRVVRDAREFASVELAHLSNLLSMLEPAVEPVDQLVDDRVWLNLAHWALRCWSNLTSMIADRRRYGIAVDQQWQIQIVAPETNCSIFA